MFRSLDHPQGAKLFLAKVTSKTFINSFILIGCRGSMSCCARLRYWECAGYGVRRVLRNSQRTP